MTINGGKFPAEREGEAAAARHARDGAEERKEFKPSPFIANVVGIGQRCDNIKRVGRQLPCSPMVDAPRARR